MYGVFGPGTINNLVLSSKMANWIRDGKKRVQGININNLHTSKSPIAAELYIFGKIKLFYYFLSTSKQTLRKNTLLTGPKSYPNIQQLKNGIKHEFQRL